jgi:glyoxylase-like metal-dependent hydrolase (beta-lactamase superfamily II)
VHRIALLVLGLAIVGCGGPETQLTTRTAAAPEIRAIDVGRGTNAYVVMGAKPILVDTGWAMESSKKKLVEGLEALGVKPKDLMLIVLTHGHGDHAGGANNIRTLSGAKVMAGQGDADMLKAGHNRPLIPMSFVGKMVHGLSDKPFEPTVADMLVTTDVDLSPYGINGKVSPAPGHTPGSLVVILPTGDALVGDMFRGGLVRSHHSERHFFHDDCPAAEAHIKPLIDAGVKRFFVGHGGPIEAEDVATRFVDDPCPSQTPKK